MRVLFALTISIFILGNVNAKTYYVSTSGSNTNSGSMVSLAWKTLTYASGSSSPVVAGDTVYVKAGNYGAESVVFGKSGTAFKPISFIGYKTSPGDAPPLLVNNTNPYAAFVTTDMPTFDGGNRASGTAFNCTGQKYLVIKNFQIQNYAYGLIAGGSNQTSGNLVLYNMNVMSMGDINASYSGYGILLGNMGTKFSNSNKVTNCQVVNVSAEGIGINGDTNTFTGCKVYCNENTNSNAPTDYYIIVTGSYNTITNCYIERAPGLLHEGHGFSIKSNASQVVDQGLSLPVINPQYNKVLYCVAKNMGESFCVRHRGVQNNLFYHCKATGTHTGAANSSQGEGNCIVTRDGASSNTFDGCIAENCSAGLVFEDTVEDGDTGTNPPGHPGNNNIYVNCLIYNCYMGINFDDYSIQSDAGYNNIANCTFYKTRYLHVAQRHCQKMKYKGNIYYGCLPNTTGGAFSTGTYASDIVPNGIDSYFSNCDFFNIEGGLPANFVANASSSIAVDPLFNNPSLLDFHLKPSSPCIDASVSLTNITTDYDNISRPQGKGYDIGALETLLLTAKISIINVGCNGISNGSATVAASGGKTPYTYVWGNGQTNPVASGLSAGNYSVTITDATSSSAIYTVSITQPTALTISNTTVINASSCSVNDATIKITASGGTGNYTYHWSTLPIQTTFVATGLPVGKYSNAVSDANGCSIVTTATVICPSPTDVVSLQNENIITVYPNPSSGIVNICTGNDNNAITISDLIGKELYKIKSSLIKTEIDMNEFPDGVYLFRIENSNSVNTVRVIIHK